MNGQQTEAALRDWRYGQPQAERLVAAILHLEGYSDIDPQHPLGGPDGLKDVLCKKDGLNWIAAAYFPTTPVSFNKIRQKFKDDTKGIDKSTPQGFAFFVNQHLTVTERETLSNLSLGACTEIYHLERVFSILNVPKGYGIRLEYLRISMTEEEQLAFWDLFKTHLSEQISAANELQEKQHKTTHEKLDILLARTVTAEGNLGPEISSVYHISSVPLDNKYPTAALSTESLCWLQRIALDSEPQTIKHLGLRSIDVWIASGADSSRKMARYIPPSGNKIVKLTNDLLDWWRTHHAELSKSSRPEVLLGLAKFHHKFLSIHPFVDGNGRVARILLDQAARELTGEGLNGNLALNPTEYYDSLFEADRGNIIPLRNLIMTNLG